MTTYDEIFKSFILNTKTDPSLIPLEDVKKYDMIKNSAKHFNNRMKRDIQCDDVTETINETFDDNDLLIFSFVMKVILLKNDLTDYVSVNSVFTKEIGRKNYRDTVRSKEEVITMAEEDLDNIIINANEDWDVIG